jgi:transposase
MRDKDLYSRILGIHPPWKVTDVDLSVVSGEVKIFIEQRSGTVHQCLRCGVECPGYDRRQRSWRHLDTCQLKTILVAEVPRIGCPEHGVITVQVPWSESGSGFTALFEVLVINWLKEASLAAVSRQLGLRWNAIDRIMQRAVDRGLRRRTVMQPEHIGVDETSFRKHHDYVTVVSDRSKVLYVCDDRNQTGLAGYYEGPSEKQIAAIKSVSMDMWPAYIRATMDAIPEADEKIAFDKFHVAKYLGEAVDKVRRVEHRALLAEGRTDLVRSKHQWLRNPNNMSHKQWREFKDLRESTLRTDRAWAIKVRSRGFRNKARFRKAIYFHLGGLDL